MVYESLMTSEPERRAYLNSIQYARVRQCPHCKQSCDSAVLDDNGGVCLDCFDIVYAAAEGGA